MMPLIITRSRSSSSTLPCSAIKVLSTVPVKRSPSVYVIVSVVVSENVEFGLKRGRRQDVAALTQNAK